MGDGHGATLRAQFNGRASVRGSVRFAVAGRVVDGEGARTLKARGGTYWGEQVPPQRRGIGGNRSRRTPELSFGRSIVYAIGAIAQEAVFKALHEPPDLEFSSAPAPFAITLRQPVSS
ncbi:hypothetical protein GCM10028798_05080 [Humibacter antri]